MNRSQSKVGNHNDGPASCVVCETPYQTDRDVAFAKTATTANPIGFYKCINCDAWFAPESASLAAALYKSRDSNNYAPNKSGWMKAIQRQILGWQYGPFIKKREATTLVDYGCGNGGLSNALVQKFTGTVFAVDVQNERPQDLDARVIYHGSDDFKLPEDRGLTIFILRHVLEHFESPVQQLQKIVNTASSGDILILETPTADSIFKVLLKEGWPGYYPPYHVIVPTLRTFRYMAERVNLRLENHKRREPPILASYLSRNADVTTNQHRIMGMIFYPLQFLFSKITGKSEAVEVILVKP